MILTKFLGINKLWAQSPHTSKFSFKISNWTDSTLNKVESAFATLCQVAWTRWCVKCNRLVFFKGNGDVTTDVMRMNATSCQADSLLALWILMMWSMSSGARLPSSNSQPWMDNTRWSHVTDPRVQWSTFSQESIEKHLLARIHPCLLSSCLKKKHLIPEFQLFYLWNWRLLSLNGKRERLVWGRSLAIYHLC